MQKNKKNLKKPLKKTKKRNFNFKPFNKKYYLKKNNIYYILGEKKPLKPLTTDYLHRNKKKKIGFILKKPSFKKILYPFFLNLKLINESLKKN